MKAKVIPPVAVALSSYRADVVIVSLLLVVTSVITYATSQMIDPVLLKDFTEDVWFGSDIERVFSNMSIRSAPNTRARVHPLFALLVFPLVKGIRAIAQVPPETAVMLLNAATTAIWVSLLYATLRLMGCRRFDATVFSVLSLSSAALLFWTTIPETYLFGSLSLLVPLFLVVLSQTRRLPLWSYVIVSAFSLSITTTNWIAGIAATIVNHTWKRTISLTGAALAIVLGLWVVQYRIFPGTTFITDIAGETNYILPKTAGGPLRIVLGLFLHPMVVPALQVIPSNRNQPEWPMLSVQHSLPGSGGITGMIALLLWIALLGFGAWACWTVRQNQKLRIVVGLVLLGQLALHLVYGEETFLYAIHMIPFLLIVVAMTTLTKWRSLVLGLAVLLIVFAGLNNGAQFSHATEFLKYRGHLRQQVPQVRSNHTEPLISAQFIQTSVSPIVS
ncbi:hypothetical protein H6F51_13855 [Cyanobacteria bacterium FACHB-DQ100]|uniref:hypothetical protein n=1 Tax=Leptolyngbya sp. DQ-M1 TaxID=2933920 RepID=UPI0019915A0F|nr:hypothetical protein [Cyanobacteria bacterium FACHB-DQ100]